jgi:hypothetical protein
VARVGTQAAVEEAAWIMPRRAPSPKRCALELLADAPEGVTEALMLAHGFPVSLLADLCMGGLAIAMVDRMVAGGCTIEVVRLKITAAGRRVLSTRP